MSLKIYLVRHGETFANSIKAYCGFTDVPLSEFGIEKLRLKRLKGDYEQPELCFTSDLIRTRQTAEILFDCQAKSVYGLRETNFGIFEMKTYLQLCNNEEFAKWVKDNNYAPPNGESCNAFKKRAVTAFERVCKESIHLKRIAVVCHGGTIAAILEKYAGSDFYSWTREIKNGQWIDLEVESLNKGFRSFWRFNES